MTFCLGLFFLVGCEPKLIQGPNTPESVKPARPEPDIAILELPKESAWSPIRYFQTSETEFRNYFPANQRLDFTLIDYPLLNAAIFYEINRRRTDLELGPYGHSPALEKAAMQHSKDMVDYDFFSHNSPVSGRETPNKRIAQFGVKGEYVGENINIGFGITYEAGRPVFTPEQNSGNFFSYDQNGVPLLPHTYNSFAKSAVDTWMNSPANRRVILSTEFRYMGIGCWHYKDQKFYGMDKFKITQKTSLFKELDE
jgi:uncharacterized protein YkwD